jgi:hypothetical protein
MNYLESLPDMFHILQAKSIDLQRHALAVHLHQDFARSHIACWILFSQLNGFLRILQRRLKISKPVMTSRTIVVKLCRRGTTDGTTEELQGFGVILTLVGCASLLLIQGCL